MGRATICVPATDNCVAINETDLSDKMAMSYGTLLARTLPDQDGYVTVTLESGLVRLIGHDAIRGELIIGHLNKRR